MSGKVSENECSKSRTESQNEPEQWSWSLHCTVQSGECGNKEGLCGTLDVQVDREQSERLLVGTGKKLSAENAPDIILKETRMLIDKIDDAGKVKYYGNIGNESDQCGTRKGRTDGKKLLVKNHAGKGIRMVGKTSISKECLSPSLKQNLKLKSFGSGKENWDRIVRDGITSDRKICSEKGREAFQN